MYDFVLRIRHPDDEDDRWAIAFNRKGEYQLLNMEYKPISGKIKRGKSERVLLEADKFVDHESQMKLKVQTNLRKAIRRALNGQSR